MKVSWKFFYFLQKKYSFFLNSLELRFSHPIWCCVTALPGYHFFGDIIFYERPLIADIIFMNISSWQTQNKPVFKSSKFRWIRTFELPSPYCHRRNTLLSCILLDVGKIIYVTQVSGSNPTKSVLIHCLFQAELLNEQNTVTVTEFWKKDVVLWSLLV